MRKFLNTASCAQRIPSEALSMYDQSVHSHEENLSCAKICMSVVYPLVLRNFACAMILLRVVSLSRGVIFIGLVGYLRRIVPVLSQTFCIQRILAASFVIFVGRKLVAE